MPRRVWESGFPKAYGSRRCLIFRSHGGVHGDIFNSDDIDPIGQLSGVVQAT